MRSPTVMSQRVHHIVFMASKVYSIPSKDAFLAFKQSISTRFTLDSLAPKQHMEDSFSIKSPSGNLKVDYYASGKLVLQGNEGMPVFIAMKSELDKAFTPLEKQSPAEAAIDLFLIDKKFFIGGDEAGTGETFGSAFVGVIAFEKESLKQLADFIKVRDVKNEGRQGIGSLFRAAKKHMSAYRITPITAYQLDINNKNVLLDETYVSLLKELKEYLPASCIIIDDYGAGPHLRNFLKKCEAEGARVILVNKADATYLPSMLASVVARDARLEDMEKLSAENVLINNETNESIAFTSGSPSDSSTEKWLREYRKINPHSDFPPFVRRKWANVIRIEKEVPKSSFEYAYTCANCKEKVGKSYFTFHKIKNATEMLCACGAPIGKSEITTTFGKCSLVLDTSAVIGRILSKDLETSRLTAGMKVILPSCLYEELDKKEPDKRRGALREIDFLKKKSDEGLIRFEEADVSAWVGMSYDDQIKYLAQTKKAILLTQDRNLAAWTALGTFVFEIKVFG